MNWGAKILLTLISIVVVTISVGIYMVSQDTDSLVEEGYYEKGLDYESVIDHKRNVALYDAQPEITIRNNHIEFLFKEKSNQGEIILKRPSNQYLDKIIPFMITEPKYTLSLRDIEKGVWEIQITWDSNEVPYYFQKRIYIQ